MHKNQILDLLPFLSTKKSKCLVVGYSDMSKEKTKCVKPALLARGSLHLKHCKLWNLLADMATMGRVKRDSVYNFGVSNEEQATAL